MAHGRDHRITPVPSGKGTTPGPRPHHGVLPFATREPPPIDRTARLPGGPMTAAPELRLALGMRGGVSLAVWMGGACSEIDRLRRALQDGGEPLYGELLRAHGYGAGAGDVAPPARARGLHH